MTNEERSELKRLYWLMTEYFEKVDIFKEKSDLERLALEISTRGMQTIGAILGEVEEHKVTITKKFYDEDANIYDCFEDAYQQGKSDVLEEVSKIIEFGIEATGHSDQYTTGFSNGLIWLKSCITNDENPQFLKQLKGAEND